MSLCTTDSILFNTSSDKREIIKTAETNAMKILGVEKLEVPEIVKPTLLEQFAQSELWSPVPETRLREDLEKTLLQVGVRE